MSARHSPPQSAALPGITPPGAGEKLQRRAARPLRAARPQKPCDLGLFDPCAARQIDLEN